MSVVDKGLIKEMLKMSPEERLDYNIRTIKTVLELRNAVKKSNAAGPGKIIKHLEEAGIEYILVGGMAAIAQGAPIFSFDLDIVHNRIELKKQSTRPEDKHRLQILEETLAQINDISS